MDSLRYYQKEIAEKICDFFYSDKKKAKIYISTGLGKTNAIALAIEKILCRKSSASIIILSQSRTFCKQLEQMLCHSIDNIEIASFAREMKGQKILVTTYQDILQNQVDISIFDLVLCDEIHFLKIANLSTLFDEKIKYLGIMQDEILSDKVFQDAEFLYSYTLKDAIRDGYLIFQDSEIKFIKSFLTKLLEHQQFSNINAEVKIFDEEEFSGRADIVAEKDNKSVIIEVKTYRTTINSQVIINNAVKQILKYKWMVSNNSSNKEFVFIIVMLCEVDYNVQKEVFQRFGVIIWDINNLIYLCQNEKELLLILMHCVPFSCAGLQAEQPLDIQSEESKIKIEMSSVEEPTFSLTDKYHERLCKCKAGRVDKSDKQYEDICTEIIKYLFETEFYKISEQHETDDEMFRMDLLCSLKGTTEFWKFLINFYHTKFVVFEYKNYTDCISQNLIYITEKYLFPVALRNVAFIISRKGFNQNAQAAAMGCLRENGKLIIDLNDNDLIKMISMKENGEEPSDYLLDKVERLLMSVSK